MDLIWRSAPASALRLWVGDDGLRLSPNDAALAWAHSRGLPDDGWRQLAQEALTQGPSAGFSEFASGLMGGVRGRLVGLPDGLLLWLWSADGPSTADPARRAVASPKGSGRRNAGVGAEPPSLQAELFAAEPEQALVPAPTAAARRLRLLCVEDNDVNMLLVRELVGLRPAFELSCASDGLSGIELALRVRPDVVLLDLQLPDIDGQEVLRRLRNEHQLRDCQWIALSANALPDQVAQTLALGFDAYWTKPIDFAQFLAGLDDLARVAQGASRSRTQAPPSSR